MGKIVIYQVFTRLFGNDNLNKKPAGTLQENGCGKFEDFTPSALGEIRNLGFTHIWYTGVLEHATQTIFPEIGVKSNAAVVKGIAGSPYAVRDYYDVSADLAHVPKNRMAEFEALIKRTHAAGLEAIIDFVPNHLAREYFSDAAPKDVEDFGKSDRTDYHFSPQNNFYYFPNQNFSPQFDKKNYEESPAKATGNDCFSPSPSVNDWYETVKLNYGVDYCGGGAKHFSPIPNTWEKMLNVLLFWAQKGVDGFRCDMAEMVPVEFWQWAIAQVKARFPKLIFIAEVYNPAMYRDYIFRGGFDFLYDKVGLYDTLRGVIAGNVSARQITHAWQTVADIKENMLAFLENHDEQRIASDFFAADAKKAFPAMIVSTLLSPAPVMIYFGQELGEKGMDAEGFSGRDGRTTIFDYWALEKIVRWRNAGLYDEEKLTADEKEIRAFYKRLLEIATEKPTEGLMYDLQYLNLENPDYNADKQFAFLRKKGKQTLLVVANFENQEKEIRLSLAPEVFDFCGFTPRQKMQMQNLLTGEKFTTKFSPFEKLNLKLPAQNGVILKFIN